MSTVVAVSALIALMTRFLPGGNRDGGSRRWCALRDLAPEDEFAQRGQS